MGFASRCQLCLHHLRSFKRRKPERSVKVLSWRMMISDIPLFLTEPKTGRTRYPTCTNTILGPPLLCAQPVRQMVHGNDPLQSPAHSNGQAAACTHTRPSSQSPDPAHRSALRLWHRTQPMGRVRGGDVCVLDCEPAYRVSSAGRRTYEPRSPSVVRAPGSQPLIRLFMLSLQSCNK